MYFGSPPVDDASALCKLRLWVHLDSVSPYGPSKMSRSGNCTRVIGCVWKKVNLEQGCWVVNNRSYSFDKNDTIPSFCINHLFNFGTSEKKIIKGESSTRLVESPWISKKLLYLKWNFDVSSAIIQIASFSITQQTWQRKKQTAF